MPHLTYENNLFIFRCRFPERHIPRGAGFRFTKECPVWHTTDLGAAVKLREYADKSAKNKIDALLIEVSPWLSPLRYPALCKPYPFQKDAAIFALSRNRAYLALQPGLGKTIIAAIVANTLAYPTVYICPPFLTRNVEAEFLKWNLIFHPSRIYRLEAGKPLPKNPPQILIVPDSIHHRNEIIEIILSMVPQQPETLLVVDEAHRFKTPTTQRTRSLFSIARGFSRHLYLSGTPMLNRPIELYPILHHAAPETIDYMDYADYGQKYCGGFFDGYGWDFSGHSNIEELAFKIKEKFMLQIRKETVLPDLPTKTESIVIIGEEPARTIAMEKKLLKEYSPAELASRATAPGELSAYRHELGLEKVKPASQIIRDSLEDDENAAVLIFAYHKDVIAALSESLSDYEPFVITGETPKKERHTIVKTFQDGGKRRVLIGNYLACGIGLTLTRATQVIFVESSWVDAENVQAADRTHRIGQKENVFIRYLVYENSLDRKILESCMRKRELNKHI